MGIHAVWQLVDNDRSTNTLPSELALLHHYRNWETQDDLNYIEDAYIPQQYGNELFQRISTVRRLLHMHGIRMGCIHCLSNLSHTVSP